MNIDDKAEAARRGGTCNDHELYTEQAEGRDICGICHQHINDWLVEGVCKSCHDKWVKQ